MIKAAGRMGWTAEEFWFCTPSFFFCALAGHDKQESDRRHIGFAQARLVAFWAAAPHGNGSLRQQDIYPLPWDEREPQYPEVSAEELAEFNEKSDRLHAQMMAQNKH